MLVFFEMKTLTPSRRLATVLASCAAITATMPVLLANHLQGRGHDFLFGAGLGASLALSIGAAVLLRRNLTACP